MNEDTELLDWLETADGYALVSDDCGKWACVCNGYQNLPKLSGPYDLTSTFFIHSSQFRPTVRQAIEVARAEAEKETQ